MSKLSLKISAAVLLLATLLLPAVKVGRNAYAEGDGMMRAENIIEAVNADCSLDEKGENKVNSVKLQPKGNDFSGVWLTFDELKEKNAGEGPFSNPPPCRRRSRKAIEERSIKRLPSK